MCFWVKRFPNRIGKCKSGLPVAALGTFVLGVHIFPLPRFFAGPPGAHPHSIRVKGGSPLRVDSGLLKWVAAEKVQSIR